MLRSRFLLVVFASVACLTLLAWPRVAHAVDYCVYHVISGFAGISPELNAGDIICVECPVSRKCPGPSGTVFTATIRDGAATEADGRLRKAADNCIACPTNGKTGYTFVNVPKVGLVEDDMDWTTQGNMVRFHLTFRNTDTDAPSAESFFDVFAQNSYGAFVPDGSLLFHGTVPPMAPASFFDVFFDIPLSQLPPSTTKIMPTFTTPAPCAPGVTWSGNIDVVWSGPGGSGMVNKHLGTLLVFPGGGVSYIHLLTGCTTPISWSLGPLCSGFSATLVNEDFSPAPANLPPGWTGWICVQANATVPYGGSCCFSVNMLCGTVSVRIDLCATACDQATAPQRRSWGEVKLIYR